MPILGTAIMDTERIIPQNGSSPGSGGSSNGGMNSNLQQSSHMMHNSSNHIPQSQQLNYSQQQHGVNSGYHHQQYVNGHTTANMLQGGGIGQSPSPIQHQGNSNANISSTSNATYSTMTGGGVGGGNIMRKKKSERTIVPLPPTSNSEHQQPLPNYNSSNGVVGGYGNALTTNAVTISNPNQFSSTNHAINVHGQTMSPSSHTGNTTHPSYGGGSHTYGSDMNTSNSHQIQTKSGVIMSSNQVVSSGGMMNHAYTRDNR